MMSELLRRASLRRGGIRGKAEAMSGEVRLCPPTVRPTQEVFPHLPRPERSEDPL